MNANRHRLLDFANSPPQRLHFTQLALFEGECDINLCFRDGIARVIRPTKGVVIEGELLDCPEHHSDTGWVVICHDGETVAAGSTAFRQLMVENASCHLRLEAVCWQNSVGQRWWDWLGFELSPTGCICVVSDEEPGSRIVSEIADDSWIRRLPGSRVATGAERSDNRMQGGHHA